MPTGAGMLRTWGDMIKFSHSVFALPFALFATFLAARPRLPTAGQLVLIVVCMVAARSAAMTFNRLADARVDASNPRTAGRALPAGRISFPAALAFFAAACVVFVGGCAGFWLQYGNPWPLLLAIPVLLALCAYSYAKYYTRWSHLILGATIAFAPVAAWIAMNPATLGWPAIVLMAAVTFWIAGFDLIYACQDTDFDRRAGLHSVPAALGIPAALNLARGFHVMTVVSLIALGVLAHLGPVYYAGTACAAVLLAYENSIVRPDDLSRVNVAFFTANGVVSLVTGLLGVVDIVL